MRRAASAVVAALLVTCMAVVGFGAPAAAARPSRTLSWHNAGDSYSSGEGVSGNQGACAQSQDAYGPKAVSLLEGEKWKIAPVAFTACTGHLAEDFRNRRPGSDKASLLDWAKQQGLKDGRADVLTLSFGGNDIGFAEIITDCLPTSDWVVGGVIGGCDDSAEDLQARVDALLSPTKRCTGGRLKDSPLSVANTGRRDATFDWGCDLLLDDRGTATPADDRRGSMIDFYRMLMRENLTSRGHLYVVGYPAVFAPIGEWHSWNAFGCAGVRWGDAAKLTAVAAYFDAKLREAVATADAGRGRATYLSRYDLFRSGRHELCGSGEDWINGLSKNRGPGVQWARYQTSFHPNGAGHSATAEKLIDDVRSVDWDAPPPVTEDELNNLRLPERYCTEELELPNGDHQLVDGAYVVNEGDPYKESAIQVGETTIGDMDGDGVADGAMSVMCASGAADHFNQVVVLRASARQLLDVDLVVEHPELDPFDARQESLTDVQALRVTQGTLVVQMGWAFQNDPFCCPTTEATGRYALRGGAFLRTGIDVHDDRARTAELASAISSGNRAEIARLMSGGDGGAFDYWIDQGAKVSAGECVMTDPLSEYRYCELVIAGDEYPLAVQWEGTSDDRTAIMLDYGD